MQKYRLNILLFIMITTSSISYAKNNLITYTSNGNDFILERKCVKNVKMDDHSDNGKDYSYTSVFFNLSKEKRCIKNFNDFFEQNVGYDVTIKFNGKAFNVTKIVSPLKAENGFSQYVPDKTLADKIVDIYK